MKTKALPLTKLALAAIDDMKGVDVRVIDVRGQTPMTDTMVICTGTSNRHVRSIAENVIREAKRRQQPPQGVEGLDSSEWVLVDLGDAIVHVMQAQTRLFYQLEKLWDIAPQPAPSRARATRKSQAKKKKSTGKTVKRAVKKKTTPKGKAKKAVRKR